MSLRALGGGELFGDKLVRIVYLDESGTSKRTEEPTVIVAGVIVHGDHQLNKLRVALAKVMEDHIPEPERSTLVLHTTDIYGGNGYFDTKRKPEWTYERRMAILADLARIPSAINLRIAWGKVDKSTFPFDEMRSGSTATNLQLSVGAAYAVCLIEIDQWFRQNAKGENCFIVVEDNNETRQFIKWVQNHHQDPGIAARLTEKERAYFPLRHIHEDPNFQEKRVAHPLVLADFIAYFVKRRLMGDARSLQFSDPWVGSVAQSQVKLPPL